MGEDLVAGHTFPDLVLPDHAGNERHPSQLAADDPVLLHFYRGWWCPKEQAYFRNLVGLQDEAEVAYTRPYLPTMFTLGPDLTIHRVYNGYWFWGRATNEELRQDFRAISRASRSDWEPPQS